MAHDLEILDAVPCIECGKDETYIDDYCRECWGKRYKERMSKNNGGKTMAKKKLGRPRKKRGPYKKRAKKMERILGIKSPTPEPKAVSVKEMLASTGSETIVTSGLGLAPTNFVKIEFTLTEYEVGKFIQQYIREKIYQE